MFIINNPDIEQAKKGGKWFERDWFGSTLSMKIRANTENATKSIKDRFKGMKDGKKKDDSIFEAVYDYLLEDFGVVNPKTGEIEPIAERLPDGSIKIMEVNIVNKKKFLFMPPPIGEENNYIFITNKANELAYEVREEEVKNLNPSPSITAAAGDNLQETSPLQG